MDAVEPPPSRSQEPSSSQGEPEKGTDPSARIEPGPAATSSPAQDGASPVDAIVADAVTSLGCAVKLPVFEGPLDLLLHLIRTNEVDISDIPITLISDQYLEYLELMRLLDIDLASDYLVMAATLAYIKSRMLLPAPGEDDEDEEGDPRAELARRLAEYAVFKEAAQDLAARPQLGRDVFPGAPDTSDLPEKEPVLQASLWALLEAMKRVLENLPEEERHHEVVRETLTVQERMVYLMDLLRTRPGTALLFEDLLTDAPLTRQRVVITFLAILELAKMQALRIFQNLGATGEPSGPVRIRGASDGEDDGDAEPPARGAPETPPAP